jgi:hypothetical protein
VHNHYSHPILFYRATNQLFAYDMPRSSSRSGRILLMVQ